ncbi:MAG: hypothetical protein AB7D36_06240, partial [Oscillospiraceae bacterium]
MMNKTGRILIPVLILALMCVLFTGCGGDNTTFSVSVSDNLGYDLTELYVIPSGQDDRGEEFLGGETLTSYSEARVIVLNKTDDGLCDLKAVDTDGDSYFFESVPLSDNASLSLELRVGAGG